MKKVGHSSEFPITIYWWASKKPEKSKFWKNEKKKNFLEISSSYTCVPKITIIWGTVPEIQSDRIFCHFGSFLTLLPPPPLNSPKNENFKKIKKKLTISSFYTSVPKIMIIRYTMPEIWHMTDVIVFFHFALFFAL